MPTLAQYRAEKMARYNRQVFRETVVSALPVPGPRLGVGKSQQEGGSVKGDVSMGSGVTPIFTPLVELIGQVINYLAATDFPGVAETISSYVAGRLHDGEYECLMRLNGADPAAYAPVLAHQYARPTDDQLTLLSRKIQTSRDNEAANTVQPGDIPLAQRTQLAGTVQDCWYANGYTKPDWFNAYILAQNWIPNPSDAIQWMIKDIADPAIQNTFLLDAEFRQKYQGHVKDVFTWNGISEIDAESTWRAHWRNMSPTTLYELHKRLRHGWTNLMSDAEALELVAAICPRTPSIPNFDPYANRPTSEGWPVPTYCEEIHNAIEAKSWLESLATDGFHVSEGLGQDDYPAFWRQRLLAISYRVLTRIDLRRAYETSQITLERLTAGFLDQGYSPPDATAQAGFTRAFAIQLHARRPVAGQWVNTGYDSDLLRTALIRQGMREDMWDDVYSILRARRDIKIQSDCLKSIENRYIRGLMTQDEADAAIHDLGVAGPDAFNLLKDWTCVKNARSKQESAAQICLEFKVGLIRAKDAVKLMTDLGYTAVQAKRVLATCFIKKLPKTYQPDLLPQALDILGNVQPNGN